MIQLPEIIRQKLCCIWNVEEIQKERNVRLACFRNMAFCRTTLLVLATILIGQVIILLIR